jgi:hypothetical protein
MLVGREVRRVLRLIGPQISSKQIPAMVSGSNQRCTAQDDPAPRLVGRGLHLQPPWVISLTDPRAALCRQAIVSLLNPRCGIHLNLFLVHQAWNGREPSAEKGEADSDWQGHLQYGSVDPQKRSPRNGCQKTEHPAKNTAGDTALHDVLQGKSPLGQRMQSDFHNSLGRCGFAEGCRKRFVHPFVLLVDVIPEVNGAVPIYPGGPIAKVNRDGFGQRNGLLEAGVHCSVNFFRRPRRVVAQQVRRQFSSLLQTNTAGTEGSRHFAKEFLRRGVMEVNVEAVREHELHAPQRGRWAWILTKPVRESAALYLVPIHAGGVHFKGLRSPSPKDLDSLS